MYKLLYSDMCTGYDPQGEDFGFFQIFVGGIERVQDAMIKAGLVALIQLNQTKLKFIQLNPVVNHN